MSTARWIQLDDPELEQTDHQSLAVEIAWHIRDEQFDGCQTRNSQLAGQVAFTLACMSIRYQWCVRASTDTDFGGFLYKVWIERRRPHA